MQKSAIIFAVLLSLVGCAKDRNVEDFQREKRAEDMAKLQTVAGVYSGILYSIDEKPLGALSISVVPDTKIGATNTNSTQSPVLIGNVTFSGTQKVSANFEQSSYDNDNKSFKALVGIRSGGNENIKIEISGVFQNESFNGRIEATGFSENGGHFSLAKGVSLSQITKPGNAVPSLPEALSYRGTMKFRSSGKVEPVQMTVLLKKSTEEERFLQLLMPVRKVEASLRFNSGLVLAFANSEWDLRVHSLLGKNLLATTGEMLTLECEETVFQLGKDGWICKYLTSGLGFVGDVEVERQ